MNDNMTEPRCLIEALYGGISVSGRLRGAVKMASPIVSWPQADETESRKSRSAVRTMRPGPAPLPKGGLTVLLLHLRDVLVVAEHPVQEPWLNRPSGGSFTA